MSRQDAKMEPRRAKMEPKTQRLAYKRPKWSQKINVGPLNQNGYGLFFV